jgi:hypothetical protein
MQVGRPQASSGNNCQSLTNLRKRVVPNSSTVGNHVPDFNQPLGIFQRSQLIGRQGEKSAMPLIKYFGFVGSTLVILLFGLSWCFPEPVSEPIRSGIDRPAIRISSVEKLPDRVNIDTSLPTIVPQPIVELTEQQPVVKPQSLNFGPIITAQTIGPVPTKQGKVRREPVKKVAAHAAPAIEQKSRSNSVERADAQVTRLSLLEVLKEGLGHGLFSLH